MTVDFADLAHAAARSPSLLRHSESCACQPVAAAAPEGWRPTAIAPTFCCSLGLYELCVVRVAQLKDLPDRTHMFLQPTSVALTCSGGPAPLRLPLLRLPASGSADRRGVVHASLVLGLHALLPGEQVHILIAATGPVLSRDERTAASDQAKPHNPWWFMLDDLLVG